MSRRQAERERRKKVIMSQRVAAKRLQVTQQQRVLWHTDVSDDDAPFLTDEDRDEVRAVVKKLRAKRKLTAEFYTLQLLIGGRVVASEVFG